MASLLRTSRTLSSRRIDRDDFAQLSADEWEWRIDDRSAISVTVGRPMGSDDANNWAVAGVNTCGYAAA